MNPFLSYLLENWALILVLLAFAIMLQITVFLDRKTIRRMYLLIASVFLLSIIVFIEFYLADIDKYQDARVVMMAIRYSATPIIIALILYTLVKKAKWYVVLPAFAFITVNIISIFTGVVFSINETGTLVRGPLGYLPYVAVGGYSFVLIFVLVLQSNKHVTEIIPITFLAFALGSGLVLPFIIGKDYSKIFCTTIAIALFVYYVFLILQLTKKDALTGLFNRQAYYSDIRRRAKDITAIVSVDMNGLKTINDNYGHDKGDEAIVSVTRCLFKSTKNKQLCYRIGGDEFIIVCTKTTREELERLINTIKRNVSKTKYSCSIGYCYASDNIKSIEEMVKKSDEMMYLNKASYYKNNGLNKR